MKDKQQSNYWWIIIYIAVVVVLSLIVQDWNNTQTIAVIVTGAVLVWYTIETKLLRIETQKQTEIQIRPFVIFEVNDDSFSLRNIGHGPALNVKIRPIKVSSEGEIILRFDQMISSIETKESVRVKGEGFERGKSTGNFYLAHLRPEHANRNLSIFIDYQNIELDTFTTRERISPQKKEIIEYQS